MILGFFPLVSPLQRHLLAFVVIPHCMKSSMDYHVRQMFKPSYIVFPTFCIYHWQANYDICDDIGRLFIAECEYIGSTFFISVLVI